MIKNLTKSGKQLFIFFFVIILLIIISAYFLLFRMNTINGNLNINKIEDIDKVYSRNAYGDIYFRIETIKKDEHFFSEDSYSFNSSYSALYPVEMSIGYDLENQNKPSFIMSENEVLQGNWRSEIGNNNNISEYIQKLKQFKSTFIKMLITQDDEYLIGAKNDAQQIIKDLYSSQVQLPIKNVNSFYTQVNTPINNMIINHYRLSKFSLDDFMPSKEWKPNIAKWSWGDTTIKLQFLKDKSPLLKDILDKSNFDNNDLVINTIKVNNNKIKKFYFIIDKKDYTIKSFFLSNDGFLYLLKLDATSKITLLNSIDDFLRIAFGIYFNEEITDRWYIEKDKSYQTKLKEINQRAQDFNSYYEVINENKEKLIQRIDKINSDISKLNEVNSKEEFLDMTELENQNNKLNSMNLMLNKFMKINKEQVFNDKMDENFENFKKYYGVYPDEQILNDLIKKIEQNKLLLDKVDNLDE